MTIRNLSIRDVLGRGRSKIACVILAGLLLAPLALSRGVAATEAPPSLSSVLAGRTLSAVIYVRRPPWLRSDSELARFMFQAYLRANGSALVRVWDEGRDAYTRPIERRWTASERRLCVGLPRPGPAQVCADVHLWGPQIAGMGISPYVMLDGDIEPGDTIRASR